MNQPRAKPEAKPDRLFGAFCLVLILGPGVAALLTGNLWWLAAYVPVGLIFGL